MNTQALYAGSFDPFTIPWRIRSRTNDELTNAYSGSVYSRTVSRPEMLRLASASVHTIVQEAIVAMLKTLDPHSTYTTAEETRALTEPLNGNFSGIGVQFQMLQDTVYVIQPVAGGPCEKGRWG